MNRFDFVWNCCADEKKIWLETRGIFVLWLQDPKEKMYREKSQEKKVVN
jgi:hypothetical protein